MDKRWVVMIREGGWWRVLARYADCGEAYRSSVASRADGTPVKILRADDPRVEKLQLRRVK